jgi:hypothetical protein
MPAEDDISLSEKRVYADTREETVVFVAGSTGVTRVAVAGDQVGRFSLAEQCDARDVAGADGRLLVATATDVLVGTGDGFAATGFGPALAVGIDDGTPVAAGESGAVARLAGDTWDEVATIPDVRAIDGPLLGAADGLYRADAGYDHAGLDDVRDVAAAGPYAATGSGLFRRHDGWEQLFGGEFDVVAATDTAAHAVGSAVWVRTDDGAWATTDLPADSPVVDVAYGTVPYAVTADGTLLVAVSGDSSPDGTAGWRSRTLGLPDTRALAVP